MLAVKIIMSQGIEVQAVNFIMSFNKGVDRLNEIGIDYKIFNISDEYLEVVKSPRYGFGKNFNPCIDCKIFMYKKASRLMKKMGASFLVTGEVLGQRPMSQHKSALNIIDRDSGLRGLVLRPLSAKLLPPTIPEEKGWVDRDKLFDIEGRSRKAQMHLAKEYNINNYFTPSGGCLLTDPGFSQRLKDLVMHNELSLDGVNLLKVGRHFRISPKARLVVGRNKDENDRLTDLSKAGDIYFSPVEDKGPVAIGRGEFSREDVLNSCRIVARYCDGKADVKVENYIWPGGRKELVLARRMEESELQRLRI